MSFFAPLSVTMKQNILQICIEHSDTVLWCNGSTPDSGSVSEGSNPSRTTAIK